MADQVYQTRRIIDTISLMLHELEPLQKAINEDEDISVLNELMHVVGCRWLEVTYFIQLIYPLIEPRMREGVTLHTGITFPTGDDDDPMSPSEKDDYLRSQYEEYETIKPEIPDFNDHTQTMMLAVGREILTCAFLEDSHSTAAAEYRIVTRGVMRRHCSPLGQVLRLMLEKLTELHG